MDEELTVESYPVWVRGLKQGKYKFEKTNYTVSYPVWVRGLKPRVNNTFCAYKVVPRVGAWIETTGSLYPNRL